MPVQITASGTPAGQNAADLEGVYTFSNGALVALFLNGSSVDVFSVSTDSGVTWTAPAAMPSGWHGLAKYTTIVQVGDNLHAWGVDSTHTMLHCRVPFTTGSNIFGATQVYATAGFGGNVPVQNGIAVAWDGSNWVLAFQMASSIMVTVMSPIMSFGGGSSMFELNWSYTTIYDLHLRLVPGTTGQVLLTIADAKRASIEVLPLSYGGPWGPWNNTSYRAESAFTITSTSVAHAPFYDAAGTLHLLVIDNGELSEVRRTGTNAYSAVVPIYNSAVAPVGGIPYAYDSSTSTILTPFRSNAGRSTGDIYAVKFAGGSWGTPSLVLGGDSSGYDLPRCSHAVHSTIAATIAKAGSAVDYLGLSPAGAPDQPTVTAPSGFCTSLTPTLTATSSNRSPGDLQAQCEWQVQTADGITTMWDTTLTQTSPNVVYAGTVLSYGVAYRARTRQKDALSASGAGTWSPWSNWVTFTPVHGPVPTIASVTSAGTTGSSSPVSLGAATFSAHVGYAQADSHTSSQARVNVYAADGVTLVDRSAWQVFSTALAAGASFDTPAHAFNLVNGTTYKFTVEMTDFTTGLSAESAQWTLNSSWVPPPTPTGFLATPNDNASIVALSWSADSSAVQVNLKWMRPSDTSWRVLVLPALTTSWTAYPTLLSTYTYGVSITNASGIESGTATAMAELGLAYDQWGIVLTDALTGESIAFGDIDNWDASKWSRSGDFKMFVGGNQVYEDDSIGLVDFESITGFEFIIPVQYPGGAPGNNGTADRDALEAMFRRRGKLIYRDAHNKRVTCRMTNWDCSSSDDVEWKVTIDLRERRPLVNEPVS
jgi:hypothetical protein